MAGAVRAKRAVADRVQDNWDASVSHLVHAQSHRKHESYPAPKSTLDPEGDFHVVEPEVEEWN